MVNYLLNKHRVCGSSKYQAIRWLNVQACYFLLFFYYFYYFIVVRFYVFMILCEALCFDKYYRNKNKKLLKSTTAHVGKKGRQPF